jgi:alpha-glucosidase (family GH31 glycosyl hydrolase)
MKLPPVRRVRCLEFRWNVAKVACLLLSVAGPVWAEQVTYRGKDAELAIVQISDQTIQVILLPLDPETGLPIAAPQSRVLVEQTRQVKLQLREVAESHEVDCGILRVAVTPNPLTVTIKRANGESVQQLSFPTDNDVAMTFRTAAPVLGMGEGAQQFDRRGAKYDMKDGWGAWERPTLGSWVAVPFLIGTDGWALLVHHPQGEFDLREETSTFTPWPNQGESPLELYVTAWVRPADVLAEYGCLLGRTPLPPKWALGFMQSHRTLESPAEVLQVAREFRERHLPCDALIYLGTGYCPAGWNSGHASLDFNPATFDKPAEMIEALHDADFKVVLHVNAPPRKLTGERIESVPAAKEARDPASPRTADISSYWARHRATFGLGVDGWWPDDGDELDRQSRIARHQVYYDGPLLDRPNVRPWNLQRTGYAGVQRYGGWIWSGDIDSRWKTLAAQVPVGLNHSLSISPFWGTDVGGFYPTRELTGELYVRWFQFGAFCPSFRAHGRTWHLRLPWGWNTGEFGPREHPEDPDPNELHNAAVEPICRKYLELRYQLLPYNYSLCREAHDTGMPLMRALWLHYPDDPHAVARGDEYLWGRDLLVAPVTVRGATERTLYLPQGDWYDFWTNEQHTGGREVTRQVDLQTLPLFVRAGAILPLDPVRQFTGQFTDQPTTLRIYGGSDGRYRWYDDDGATLDYLNDEFAWTDVRWDDVQRTLTIEPTGAGKSSPLTREIVVELLPSREKKSLSYEGKRTTVAF